MYVCMYVYIYIYIYIYICIYIYGIKSLTKHQTKMNTAIITNQSKL